MLTIVLKAKKSKFSLSLRSLLILQKSLSDLAMKWNWQVWPQYLKIYCHLISLRLNYFQGIIIIKKPAFVNTMEHFYCIIQLWCLHVLFLWGEIPDPSSPPIPQKILLILHNAALLTTVPSPAPDLLRLQFCAKSKHRFAKKSTDWKQKVTLNDIIYSNNPLKKFHLTLKNTCCWFILP